MTAKWKAAGSDPVDGFSALYIRAIVGYMGTWGGNLGKE